MAKKKAKKTPNAVNASANTDKGKMTLKDYHELAERRIGEYDAHAVRYKQWLAPVVTGFVLAAYFSKGHVELLIRVGTATIILLFLVEMTLRSVNARMICYAKRLEHLMGHGGKSDPLDAQRRGFGHFMNAKFGETRMARALERLMGHGGKSDPLDAQTYGFGHSMEAKPWETWSVWVGTTGNSVRRVGAILPYIVAGLVLAGGVWLASELKPKSAPESRTKCCECVLNRRDMPQPLAVLETFLGLPVDKVHCFYGTSHSLSSRLTALNGDMFAAIIEKDEEVICKVVFSHKLRLYKSVIRKRAVQLKGRVRFEGIFTIDDTEIPFHLELKSGNMLGEIGSGLDKGVVVLNDFDTK